MGDLQVWESEVKANTAINRKKGMKTNDASQIVAYFFHLKMKPSIIADDEQLKATAASSNVPQLLRRQAVT